MMYAYRRILVGLVLLNLANCGFGNQGANPLNSKTDNGQYKFGTETDANKTIEEYEKSFQLKETEYDESVTRLKKESEQQNAELETKYQDIVNRLHQQSTESLQQCNQEKQVFADEFSDFKSKQDAVVSNMTQVNMEYKKQIDQYKRMLENPERQSFQGYIHTYDLNRLLPQALEWQLGVGNSYSFIFSLDLNSAQGQLVKGFTAEPALPPGLKIVKDENNRYLIQGSPDNQAIQFKEGKSIYRSIHVLKPEIDKRQLDRLAGGSVAQQTFEIKVMIVIYKGEIPGIDSAIEYLEESH
ncbi:MAG: hypothetical protein KDD50_00260 [Bdellovibrionales bacterium]|nr:hypothetical protein [Bdellovibrionales bacterium]